MRTFGRSIAFLTLLFQVLVPASAAGQEAFQSTAGTVVDDSTAPIVTVTVNIDLVVPDPSGKGKEMADGIAQQIMDFWNLEFEKLSTDCLQWNLAVIINPVPKSALRTISVNGRDTYVTTPGRHVVIWEGTGPNAPWPETYDAYDPDQMATPGEDYSTPYSHELWAIWSGRLETPRDYAHEFGHLLGFGDDYRPPLGLHLPGRQDSLMANGNRVDQNLADRLANVIKDSGQQLPECWRGTYSGSVTWDCGPLGKRSGTLQATFTIKVGPDRGAVMAIQHTVVGSCAGPNMGKLTTPIEAMGKRTPTGFEFPAFFGGTGSIVLTVDGDRGSGKFTGSVPGPATVSVTLEIERA